MGFLDHLMELRKRLWKALVVRDGELWTWTYAKSQKVRNLERDQRATLQIEAGLAYDQLRGVMLECEVTIHRDPDVVRAFGEDLVARYFGAGTAPALGAGLPRSARVP